MAPIIRPTRKATFAGSGKGTSIPLDMLDAQIQNLIDAISSTQAALADIRRDDGKIKNKSIGPEQLSAELRHSKAEIDDIEQRLIDASRQMTNTAAQIADNAKVATSRVKSAESSQAATQVMLGVARAAEAAATDAISDAENAADRAEYAATQSENSSQYSRAQSDNAIAANVEASTWAEYLAGPVVNSNDAPAYIAGHPFGHGLYYQPVEGYGGVAGLWSAKWWAIYAAQLVGPWSFYYLGSWSTVPVPGSTNPNTGVKVPSPLMPGSFYYNTTLNQLFVWDGTQWIQPFVQVLTPGFTSSFVYVATVGQKVFSGLDSHGQAPIVGLSPSDVHVNGLRLVYGTGYTVNATTNTLTLVQPSAAGDVVQWDLLAGTEDTLDVGVNIRKVAIAPAPDGTRTEFLMTWIDPGTGTQPTEITGGPQLQLSVDGIVQEPGVDFVASGDVLTFGTAPSATAKIWGVWYAVAAAGGVTPPTNTIPVNIASPVVTGSTIVNGVLTATTGDWTGYPVPTFAIQWKRGGTNVGTNSNTYTLVESDIGFTLTATVTATNVAGSANATSAATSAVTGIAPFNTVAPIIAGTATEGQTLTLTSTGTWTGTPTPTFTRQWKRGGPTGSNVGTGTSSYLLVTADVGSNMCCVVTATNSVGGVQAPSNLRGPVSAIGGAAAVRLVAIGGDSNSCGRGLNGGTGADVLRDPVLDQNLTDVWQFCNNNTPGGGAAVFRTLSSDITPLYHPEGYPGDRIGPGEQLGRSLKARYPGDIIVLIPCGFGGQSLTGPGASWAAPGGAQYLNMIDSITRATAAVNANGAWSARVVIPEMVYFDLGANDVALASGGVAFHAAQKNLINTFRGSGMPSWAGVRWMLAGLPYEDIPVPTGQEVERAHLQTVAEVTGVYYVKGIPDVLPDTDNIHRDVPACRDMGSRAAVVDQNTSFPVWPTTTPIYNAAFNVLDVPFAGDFAAIGVESGSVVPLDANFEVANVYALNRTLRHLGNSTKSSGTRVPTLSIIGGNRVTTTVTISVVTVPAGSMDLGDIIPIVGYGFSLDPANMTRQWQDAGGTTPAVIDQVVGRVVDGFDNTLALTQATAANKPLLKRDGTIWNWQGDGVNDTLIGTISTTRNLASNAYKFTVVCLIKASGAAQSNKAAVAQAAAAGPAFHHAVRTNDGNNITFQLRNDASSGPVGATVAGVLDGTWKIVSMQYGGGNTLVRTRINGGAWTTVASGSMSGNFSLDRIALFSNPAATPNSWFNGSIGGVWAIAEYVSVGMLAIAEQDYALRAGITLPGGPSAIGAPSLNLIPASDTGVSSTDNITSDTTPDFDITFAVAPVAGDIVVIKDGATTIVTHTVTAAEATSGTIDLGLSPLTDGSHSFVASHASGASAGTDSVAHVVVIDTTAPNITTLASQTTPENAVKNITLTADETIASWALSPTSPDPAKFTLVGNTLTMFAQDYEDPLAGDNAYAADVIATDVAGNSSTQRIIVAVTDVVEATTPTTRQAVTAGAVIYGVMGYNAINIGARQSNAGTVFVAEN